MKEKLKIIILLLLISHLIFGYFLLNSNYYYKPLIINDLVYAWLPVIIIVIGIIYLILKRTYKNLFVLLMSVVSILIVSLYWYELSLFVGYK